MNTAHPRRADARPGVVVYLLLAAVIAAPTAFAMRPVLQVLDLGTWTVVVLGLAVAIVAVVELVVRAVRR